MAYARAFRIIGNKQEGGITVLGFDGTPIYSSSGRPRPTSLQEISEAMDRAENWTQWGALYIPPEVDVSDEPARQYVGAAYLKSVARQACSDLDGKHAKIKRALHRMARGNGGRSDIDEGSLGQAYDLLAGKSYRPANVREDLGWAAVPCLRTVLDERYCALSAMA